MLLWAILLVGCTLTITMWLKCVFLLYRVHWVTFITQKVGCYTRDRSAGYNTPVQYNRMSLYMLWSESFQNTRLYIIWMQSGENFLLFFRSIRICVTKVRIRTSYCIHCLQCMHIMDTQQWLSVYKVKDSIYHVGLRRKGLSLSDHFIPRPKVVSSMLWCLKASAWVDPQVWFSVHTILLTVLLVLPDSVTHADIAAIAENLSSSPL